MLSPTVGSFWWNETLLELSKFRIASHNLEIERGRYTNTAKEDRLCKYVAQTTICKK